MKRGEESGGKELTCKSLDRSEIARGRPEAERPGIEACWRRNSGASSAKTLSPRHRTALMITAPYTRCPYRVSCPKNDGAVSFALTAMNR